MSELKNAFGNAVTKIEYLLGQHCLESGQITDSDLREAHHVAAMMDALRFSIEESNAGRLTMSTADHQKILTVLNRLG